MTRFRLPIAFLVVLSLFLSAGCSKKPEKPKQETPVVQEMNIVQPSEDGSDSQ